MPGTNLTREEAASRSALLAPVSYHVELDLTRGAEIFGSTTTIRFTAREPGAATFVDLVADRVHAVTLNGRRIDPAAAYRDGRIHLDGLAADNELSVVADCAYSRTGQGLHRTVDTADGRVYLYTHFEVPDARRVFATFEQPDLKAPFSFTVTAPAHWVVLSNMPTPDPEPAPPAEGAGTGGGGAAVWRFPATAPISTYLTALVAGEYHLVRDAVKTATGQLIPVAVGCRASLAAHLDAAEILDVTRRGFDHFVAEFGRPYPFDKYDQVFVPEYNIGAMENAGCVTVTEAYLFRSRTTDARYEARATTLLHEMAHMWFGDLVTMRWWDDLWLKESFATYVAYRAVAAATRWTGAWTSFANDNKAWGYVQDQLPSTHPIVADIRDLQDVGVNFDGITYAKGAAVLQQLATWVGTGPFREGIRDYLERHAWGNTTLADLLAALERASGRDLASWSRDWLQAAGTNTLSAEFDTDEHGRFHTFELVQQAPADHPVLRPHHLAIGLYRRGAGGLTRVHRVELDVAGARTRVPELSGLDRPDLVLLNDGDLTFARIRFDPASLRTVLTSVGELSDPLARALCWTAAWDMVRNAELPARDYLEMVRAGIGTETVIGTITAVHRTLPAALSYVDPAHEPLARRALAAAARERLASAPAGGDAQLAWAHVLVQVAADPCDLDLLAALRDGTETLPGLEIDAELRWALLAGLARHGRAGGSDIEAELARDRTTTGTGYAAGIRAARPDAASKAAAWAALVDRDDLPNGVQATMTGGRTWPVAVGFQQPGQQDLLRAYVDRYFEAVERIWATRPLEVARRLATGLYPRAVIEDATVARTDAALRPDRGDGGGLPPALRRLLAEGRDDVARALRARAADRAGGASAA